MMDPTLAILTLATGCALFIAFIVFVLWDLNR
jgi:hypothetical protein